MPSKKDITTLLEEMSAGKAGAEENLLPLIYNELHVLAERCMQSQQPGHTLQPTALVHEAYIRLRGSNNKEWKNRSHYLRVAAKAMRGVLVDHARRKHSQKRGGQWQRISFEVADDFLVESSVDLVALDQVLTELMDEDKRLAQLVELRFFGGLTIKDTADVLGISTRTATYDWKMARAWLIDKMAL